MTTFPLNSNIIARRNVSGVVPSGRVFVPSVNLQVADIVELARVPKSAYIIDIIIGQNVSSTMTIDVGDSQDSNKYLSSTVLASSAIAHMTQGSLGLMSQNLDEFILQLTINSITNPDTSGQISSVVLYAMSV